MQLKHTLVFLIHANGTLFTCKEEKKQLRLTQIFRALFRKNRLTLFGATLEKTKCVLKFFVPRASVCVLLELNILPTYKLNQVGRKHAAFTPDNDISMQETQREQVLLRNTPAFIKFPFIGHSSKVTHSKMALKLHKVKI